MDIVKMTFDSWNKPGLVYVGRINKNGSIGLGNPYGTKWNSLAYYYVSSEEKALNRYRDWVEMIISALKKDRISSLRKAQQDYYKEMAKLAEAIQEKECIALGCWCITIKNYIPVPDGKERCHAEILYKACLKINELANF